MARVRHQAIVPIHDVFFIDDDPWIVMEYISGRSLHDIIKQQTLDERSIARIGLHVLRGLVAVHRANVVHRDVKPTNILVADDDSIFLVDFGIARIAGDASLTGQSIVGTLDFLAPERFRSGYTVGPPADIWALGVTFYYALEGYYPVLARQRARLGSHHDGDTQRGAADADPRRPAGRHHAADAGEGPGPAGGRRARCSPSSRHHRRPRAAGHRHRLTAIGLQRIAPAEPAGRAAGCPSAPQPHPRPAAARTGQEPRPAGGGLAERAGRAGWRRARGRRSRRRRHRARRSRRSQRQASGGGRPRAGGEPGPVSATARPRFDKAREMIKNVGIDTGVAMLLALTEDEAARILADCRPGSAASCCRASPPPGPPPPPRSCGSLRSTAAGRAFAYLRPRRGASLVSSMQPADALRILDNTDERTVAGRDHGAARSPPRASPAQVHVQQAAGRAGAHARPAGHRRRTAAGGLRVRHRRAPPPQRAGSQAGQPAPDFGLPASRSLNAGCRASFAGRQADSSSGLARSTR